MSIPLFTNPISPQLTSGDAILTGTGLILQEQPIYGTNVSLQSVNTNGTLLNTISMVGCNVGFGTTIPSNKLHVQGQTYFNGNVGIGTLPTNQGLTVQGNAFFNSNIGIGTLPTNQAVTVQGNMRIDGTLQTLPIIVSSSGLLQLGYIILFDSSLSSLTVQLPDASVIGYTVLLKLLYPASIYSVTVQMSGSTYGLLGSIQLNSTIPSYQLTYTSTGWQIINELSDSFFPTTQQGTKLVGSGYIGASVQGQSVALSSDGNTLAVGGISDNSFIGATWIFIRSGTTWTQQGSKLVGTGYTNISNQGKSVALSSDGNTLAVGGYADNTNIGATWIFTRSGTTWTQQGTKLVGTGYTGGSFQGNSVVLSADGNTLAIGANRDNSNIGATWIFIRSGTTWTQQGTKLVGTGYTGTSFQGQSVALSADGNKLAIGGYNDNSTIGATWIFTRSGTTWTQQGSKLVGTGYTVTAYKVSQGYSVALSADGNTLVVGANEDNNLIGATWIFTFSGTSWNQQGNKLVGSGYTGTVIQQGISVALSSDGNTLSIGGQNDNNNIGTVWIFTRLGTTWTQQGNKLVGTGNTGASVQGISIAVSSDANTLAVGGNGDNTNRGATWVFT